MKCVCVCNCNLGETCSCVNTSRLHAFTEFLSRMFRENDEEIEAEKLFRDIAKLDGQRGFAKEEARSCLDILDNKGKILLSGGIIYNI